MRSISKQALLILFFIIAMAISGIVRQIVKISFIHSPILFFIGIFLSIFTQHLGIVGQSIKSVHQIDPYILIIVFIPLIVFHQAFNSHWHVFRKQSGQIFLLSFPCFILSAFLLMFTIKIILGYENQNFTWRGAFLFGSILSCTDGSGIIKQFNITKRVKSLIEGQSLVNDGTCMVLFTLSLNKLSNLFLIESFVEMTVGGIILGLLLGILMTYLIEKILYNEILVLNVLSNNQLTLVSAYAAFVLAGMFFDGGGVFAIVVMGLYMAQFSKTKMNSQTIQTLQAFWTFLLHFCQSITYLTVGILIGPEVHKFNRFTKSDHS